MERFTTTYSGKDESAAEQFRRLAEILGDTRPVYILPTLLNSWANYGSGYQGAGYYKDPLSRVHFTGLITGGASATTALVLPVDYRPLSRLAFSSFTSNAGTFIPVEIDVLTDGSVNIYSSLAPSYVSLSSICFAANA